MGRIIGISLSVVVLVIGVAFVGAFGAHAVARQQTADEIAIRAPNGIDEERFVRIAGIDQWITIRGQDRSNPVLLVLHGGPGSPESYLVRQFLPLERHFVVVQWDQRGSGKTLGRAGGPVDPNLDIATMVRDGIAVSEYLRQHLHRNKIVVLGQSWGAILGVKMAQARPDLYAAFVGTGMAVCSQDERQSWQYAYLQARAKAVGDAKGLAELKLAGPPPWPDESDNMKHMVQAAGPYLPPALSYDDNVRAVLTAPHWSLSDVMALQRGIGGIRQTVLWREVLDMDFAHFGETFAMPVVIVQGELDLTTPTEFARAWLGRAKAPAKALAVIQGQGHEVLSYDNAAFAEALYAHLTPLLSSNPAS